MIYHEEQRKALSELTLAITAALGQPWKAIEPEESDRAIDDISNGDGAILCLSIQYNHTNRVSVSGSMHYEQDGRWQYVQVRENGKKLEVPSISVAIERGPEVIAKEIKRRLLPTYLHAVELAKAQVKRENVITATRQANIRKLVQIDGTLPDFKRYPETDRFYLGKRSGTVVVHYDGSVNFERLDMSMEEAEYILRYLRQRKKDS